MVEFYVLLTKAAAELTRGMRDGNSSLGSTVSRNWPSLPSNRRRISREGMVRMFDFLRNRGGVEG